MRSGILQSGFGGAGMKQQRVLGSSQIHSNWHLVAIVVDGHLERNLGNEMKIERCFPMLHMLCCAQSLLVFR